MSLAFKMLGALLMTAAFGWMATEGRAEVGPGLDTASVPLRDDSQRPAASRDVRTAADWIVGTADHRHLPFAIVDKKAAQIVLFDRDGRVIAMSTALLGLAPGDSALPGAVGRRPASLRPAERTTPAGRFTSEPGHNAKGEAIVWIDYAASLAIHRLRPAAVAERRPQRMASAVPADKRISFGCVIVPGAFYDAFVAPSLGRGPGIVYVLPESRPVEAMFGDGVRVGSSATR